MCLEWRRNVTFTNCPALGRRWLCILGPLLFACTGVPAQQDGYVGYFRVINLACDRGHCDEQPNTISSGSHLVRCSLRQAGLSSLWHRKFFASSQDAPTGPRCHLGANKAQGQMGEVTLIYETCLFGFRLYKTMVTKIISRRKSSERR